MKQLFLCSIIAFLSLSLSAQDFFDRADTFLSTHVSSGMVDYEQISIKDGMLQKLVEDISDFSVESADRNTAMAFYLNAYNILAIKNVMDHYPISSPMDVDGFFDRITFNVAGKNLSLNQIENDIIRPTYQDARIHFALVCVAQGCPPITGTAFTASNLEAELEKRTRMAMNSAGFTRLNQAESKLELSEIFKWYIVDFGNSEDAVRGYVNKYRHNPVPDSYSYGYYSYDWKLNKLQN